MKIAKGRMTLRAATIFLILLTSTSCEATVVNQDDSIETINTLISKPDEKYVIDGTYNALLANKGWAELYNKYRSAARNQGQINNIKIYLLLGFVAQLKAQVATSVAFSSDLYSFF